MNSHLYKKLSFYLNRQNIYAAIKTMQWYVNVKLLLINKWILTKIYVIINMIILVWLYNSYFLLCICMRDYFLIVWNYQYSWILM